MQAENKETRGCWFNYNGLYYNPEFQTKLELSITGNIYNGNNYNPKSKFGIIYNLQFWKLESTVTETTNLYLTITYMFLFTW